MSCSIKRVWRAADPAPFIAPASISGRNAAIIQPPGWVFSISCRQDPQLHLLRRPAERFVDLLDRATACLKSDEPEAEGAEHIPEGQVVETRYQCIESRSRLDVVGLARDQR
jgi:hypothetical protein